MLANKNSKEKKNKKMLSPFDDFDSLTVKNENHLPPTLVPDDPEDCPSADWIRLVAVGVGCVCCARYMKRCVTIAHASYVLKPSPLCTPCYYDVYYENDVDGTGSGGLLFNGRSSVKSFNTWLGRLCYRRNGSLVFVCFACFHAYSRFD